jgi:hypothetical protein
VWGEGEVLVGIGVRDFWGGAEIVVNGWGEGD